MAITLISPFGAAGANFVMLAGVRWDRQFSKNVELIGNNLTVIGKGGEGQGTCIPPEISQSSGVIYWEFTWTGLSNTGLQGGVGLCTPEAIADYDALAADGTGGIIFRPDGTGFENSNPLIYYTLDGITPTPLQEGYSLGIFLDFESHRDEGNIAVQAIVYGGEETWRGSDLFLFPQGDNYIPCAVFDSASIFDIYAVTANFSDYNSFLGLTAIPGAFNGVTLGWPNTK